MRSYKSREEDPDIRVSKRWISKDNVALARVSET